MQNVFIKYLSSYDGQQAIHSYVTKIVFKMLFRYINFSRFLLPYVSYLRKNVLTGYNPTPGCVAVYHGDKFGIGDGKKSSFARSRKDLLYFSNFGDTVQYRIPQNLCEIRHRLPCETKEKIIRKRDTVSRRKDVPELGSHVQSGELNEFLNSI